MKRVVEEKRPFNSTEHCTKGWYRIILLIVSFGELRCGKRLIKETRYIAQRYNVKPRLELSVVVNNGCEGL